MQYETNYLCQMWNLRAYVERELSLSWLDIFSQRTFAVPKISLWSPSQKNWCKYRRSSHNLLWHKVLYCSRRLVRWAHLYCILCFVFCICMVRWDHLKLYLYFKYVSDQVPSHLKFLLFFIKSNVSLMASLNQFLFSILLLLPYCWPRWPRAWNQFQWQRSRQYWRRRR